MTTWDAAAIEAVMDDRDFEMIEGLRAAQLRYRHAVKAFSRSVVESVAASIAGMFGGGGRGGPFATGGVVKSAPGPFYPWQGRQRLDPVAMARFIDDLNGRPGTITIRVTQEDMKDRPLSGRRARGFNEDEVS